MEKPPEGKAEALGSRNRLWLHCPGLLESQLTEYFNQFGPVLDLYIPRDRHNGSRKNFGFATFEDEEGLRRTLAAGSEHIISGKVVRVNLAGPRPEAPLVYAPPAYPQQQPQSPATGLQQLPGGGVRMSEGASAAAPGGAAAVAAAPRGSGPRIYVGGIPTAVSETMVRNHFTQWGAVTDVYFPKDRFLNRRKNFCFVTFATQQAAEKAAAQSDREINGYRIESISITHDRQEHYQRQGVTQPAQVPGAAAAFAMPGAPLSMPGEGSMRWMGSSLRAIQGGSPGSGSSSTLGRSPVAPSTLKPMVQRVQGGASSMLGPGHTWPAVQQQPQPQPYRGMPYSPVQPQMPPPPPQQQPGGYAAALPDQLSGTSPVSMAGGYGAIDMMLGMGGAAGSGAGAGGSQEEQALAAQMAQYSAYMQQYAAALYLSGQQQQQQQQPGAVLGGGPARSLSTGGSGPLMSMGMVAAALPEFPPVRGYGGEGQGGAQDFGQPLASPGSGRAAGSLGQALEGAGSAQSDVLSVGAQSGAAAAQLGTSASSGQSALAEAAEAFDAQQHGLQQGGRHN